MVPLTNVGQFCRHNQETNISIITVFNNYEYSAHGKGETVEVYNDRQFWT